MSPNPDEPPAETAEKVLPKNKDAVPKIKSEKELIEEKSFHLAPWITGRANSYATEKMQNPLLAEGRRTNTGTHLPNDN